MTSDQMGAVDTFGIALPDSWGSVPLEEDAFDGYTGEVLERLRREGTSAADVRSAELLLRQGRKLLVESRVRFFGFGVTVVSEGETLCLVLGSVALLEHTREGLGSPVPLTPAAILRGLGGAAPADATRRSVDLEPPDRVRLPAGKAVRLRRLLSGGGVDDVEYFSQSFILPFADGERMVTMQCVTPNVDQAVAFSRLFDSMARSLRLFREGEETSFESDAGTHAATPDDESNA